MTVDPNSLEILDIPNMCIMAVRSGRVKGMQLRWEKEIDDGWANAYPGTETTPEPVWHREVHRAMHRGAFIPRWSRIDHDRLLSVSILWDKEVLL